MNVIILLYYYFLFSLFSIGINSNASNNSSYLRPQILLSIPKTENPKINQQLSSAFHKGLNFSNCDIIPKIYSIILNEEKDIIIYLYILLFYEKISDVNSEIKTNNESLYCPLSIIITSHYANIDFFKESVKSLFKKSVLGLTFFSLLL